ncbi:MAG TPA: pantoate--beta-alanine ligase [Actinomycetota bacterium]|nr:pantoate--beta-alanine ligase [Actinomycetota bacterium]
MEVIETRGAYRDACERARQRGRDVGFVATMGFLHEGHRSLLGRARDDNAFVAMSIFVNPLQFGPAEDLESYPRDLDRDVSLAEKDGVDVVFAPSADEMYARGRPGVTVDPGPLGERFEGTARPGHFRGVCTVVAKLFALTGPCRAYFGEKDAQQLAVIRAMVRDLEIPVEVVGCPTVREEDGLAMSSRNGYLSEEERRAATCLYEALARARWLVEGGERDANVLRAEVAKRVGAEPLARIEYAAVVDEETFDEVDVLRRPARALVAATLGNARLIDNLPLPVDDEDGGD